MRAIGTHKVPPGRTNQEKRASPSAHISRDVSDTFLLGCSWPRGGARTTPIYAHGFACLVECQAARFGPLYWDSCRAHAGRPLVHMPLPPRHRIRVAPGPWYD